MNLRRIPWITCLLVGVVVSASVAAQQPSVAEAYLELIKQSLGQTRKNLPTSSAAAEQASKYFLKGGTIWAGGRQAGFDGEAFGRAGGLMTLRKLRTGIPATGDIVLYAAPGTLNAQDRRKIKAWKSQGICVVAFASKAKKDKQGPASDFLIENLPTPGLAVKDHEQQKLIPVDTVHNVINLWVWTGEFVAACTRVDKMPTMYLSYGLPDGRERGKKYKGQTFHDDFKIAPIKAGLLGKAYLKVIETAVDSLRTQQIADIQRAAQWLRATSTQNVTVLHIGHLFPGHLQDSRTPQPFNRIVSNIGQKGIGQIPAKEMLVIGLSYQQAPKPILAQAKASGMKYIYDSVCPGAPPEPAKNIIYIKPGWPLPDACVKVPGYDVDILPASGAMNAIIYWSILADRCDPLSITSPRGGTSQNPQPEP